MNIKKPPTPNSSKPQPDESYGDTFAGRGQEEQDEHDLLNDLLNDLLEDDPSPAEPHWGTPPADHSRREGEVKVPSGPPSLALLGPPVRGPR